MKTCVLNPLLTLMRVRNADFDKKLLLLSALLSMPPNVCYVSKNDLQYFRCMNSSVLVFFYLVLSEKLRSNIVQATWAFVSLGHLPRERGLLIVSTIIKYVREIKINVAAKPPNFGCYTWFDPPTTNNTKLLPKLTGKFAMAIVDP